MSKHTIHILQSEVANKIAAGEVVERPASVVKELVENSIDAGATDITIILKEGGKDHIHIVDNGNGMNEADFKLAFERHATSKIITAQDLETINTLGFRGEALASIASVSRVEAKTVESGAISGTELHLDGGKVVLEKPAAGNQGTSIAVKNIFHNIPARRKFLKAASTEYRRCMKMASRIALSHPAISFTFIHNDNVIWEVKAQPLKERVCAILGNRLQNKLIEIEEQTGAVGIHGVVGDLDTIRKISGEQYLYLNGRYIVDRSLNHAITSGYGEILHHGGYPLYVLFLELDPTRVDVNVHPTKMEVKFLDDRMVYSILRGVVRKKLVSSHTIPDLQPQRDKGEDDSASIAAQLRKQSIDFSASSSFLRPDKTPVQKSDFFQSPKKRGGDSQLNFDMPAQQKVTPQEFSKEQSELEAAHDDGQSNRLAFQQSNLFQVHKKYILSQTNSGLVVIDQHAAHERILYERALKNFENLQPRSQKLLFPKMIELSASDFEMVKEMEPFLLKLGFMLGEFGKNTIVIEGMPTRLRVKDYDKLMANMIDDYKRGKRNNLEIRDNVAKTWACHGSIRAGDPLTIDEMNALITQLFDADTPYFCPHGRPVIVKITVDELDKRFGRT